MNTSTDAARLSWSCAICGVSKPGTKHQMRQRYCSRRCMALSYGERMTGDHNPNFRNLPSKSCVGCGGVFFSYTKTRQYCSARCYQSVRAAVAAPKPKSGRKPAHHKLCVVCSKSFPCNRTSHKITCSTECSVALRQSKVVERACLHCSKTFRFSPSQKRKYCSYACHIASGGSARAGEAAARAKMKYGTKKDANHNEIMEVMRKYCAVYDLSNAGMGVPDGVAWVNGAWHLFDIKNPKTAYGRRGLNRVQTKWIQAWAGGPVYLIYTTDEAARFAQGQIDGIKFVRGGLVDAAEGE